MTTLMVNPLGLELTNLYVEQDIRITETLNVHVIRSKIYKKGTLDGDFKLTILDSSDNTIKESTIAYADINALGANWWGYVSFDTDCRLSHNTTSTYSEFTLKFEYEGNPDDDNYLALVKPHEGEIITSYNTNSYPSEDNYNSYGIQLFTFGGNI